MSRRTRYAIVGTGGRAEMYIKAVAGPYQEVASLVGFCDLSQTRMDWYNRMLRDTHGLAPVPTYDAGHFERMIAETRPDVMIVATIDAAHHDYICRAMDLGCDVITEKPMTTDAAKARAIFGATERTGRSLRVAFNYRYAPAYTQFYQLIRDGAVGRPLLVDFSWLLDTYHGADYFRRWHREKHNSGGLLVHKATHHFDLVNWWIESYPQKVFALGELKFYGKANAAARAEHYSYDRYTGEPAAKDDRFALFLDQNSSLTGLYLAAEADSGYIRDRNVFGEPITIEDTMTVTARYRNGVLLSYCLVAYSPWEGLRVAVTGDKGRIELEVMENVSAVMGQAEETGLEASTGSFKQTRLTVFPMFGRSYEVEIPAGQGGHGGADPVMLEHLFAETPPSDPYNRAASHVDGVASVLLGIAANQSIETGECIHVDSLFPL